MGEPANSNAPLNAEVQAILSYLKDGAAKIEAVNQSKFTLSRKNAEPIYVSAKDLASCARRNLVKRNGKLLALTDHAPRAIQAMHEMRETVDFELAEGGETRTVTRVKVESPIDYLAARKDKSGIPILGKIEWAAGDRLRSDFTRANMLPQIGMRWGEPIRVSGGAGCGVTQTDAAIAARARVNKALEAVGPEFSGLMIDICCFLKGLEQVEMERGWPQRSAKVMLRAGLSILARHYTPATNSTAKTRSWGVSDYRPTL
jgi:hypothetical protein